MRRACAAIPLFPERFSCVSSAPHLRPAPLLLSPCRSAPAAQAAGRLRHHPSHAKTPLALPLLPRSLAPSPADIPLHARLGCGPLQSPAKPPTRHCCARLPFSQSNVIFSGPRTPHPTHLIHSPQRHHPRPGLPHRLARAPRACHPHGRPFFSLFLSFLAVARSEPTHRACMRPLPHTPCVQPVTSHNSLQTARQACTAVSWCVPRGLEKRRAAVAGGGQLARGERGRAKRQETVQQVRIHFISAGSYTAPLRIWSGCRAAARAQSAAA